MSAIVLTRTADENGFVQGSILFYLAAFAAALLLPFTLQGIPFIQTRFSFPEHLLLSFVLSVLFILALDKIFKRKLRQQIKILTRSAKRYAKGDFSTPLPSWNDDAMDVLAGTIAHTIQNFQNKIDKDREEKEKLAVILNHMQEGVIGVDGARNVRIHNPSASEILGSAKNGLGKSLIEFTHSPEMDEAMRLAVDGQKSVAGEIESIYPAKKTIRIMALGIDSQNTEICGILVLHDITTLKNLEKTRQEFVANVSHELKTPLTSIKGFIETLLSGALKDSAQSEKFLKIMGDDAERLSRLIDDLLTLSSVESRKIALKIEGFSIQDEIQKTLAALQPAIQKQDLKVSLDFPRVPTLYADRDRIRQVLINLLNNAVKFNRPGGTITVQTFSTGSELQVLVSDTGIGIPETDIARVFERFFRVDKARSRDAGGTGLGLSIAKHIIEAHGGKIFCESRLDHGSTFKFSLPLSGIQN